MTDTLIHCPQCKAEIPLTEALSAQIRTQLEAGLTAEHQQQLREAVENARRNAKEAAGTQLASLQVELETHTRRAREAEGRELELKRQTLKLEETQRTLAERIRIDTEEKLRSENETRLQTLVQEATTRARGETALELKLAQEQLTEERRKLIEAQQHELALRQQAVALEERTRSLDLELARKLDEKKNEWEAGLRQSLGEEQTLKLREKEKQIDDLRKVIDDLKRKSEQGSQELQGEVLELDIQTALERLFPFDTISPVPKGVAGADLIQTVRNGAGQACGSIVWEMKNTRHWQSAWLAKLKDDQRAVGANLAVLVSVALPEDIRGFGEISGVWITSLALWPTLASVLREQLIEVAFAHTAAEGKNEKMEMLYRYLAGDQFRSRVQGIVEAFDASLQQIAAERRAMEKQWKEREKQLERVMINTSGLYGEMRGIVGRSIACVPALELDATSLLENVE